MAANPSSVQQVAQLRDDLVKAAEASPPDSTRMLQILNVALNTKINLDMLQKTKFGRHVNMCRKKPGVTQEVQALAKKLAREYKAMQDQAGPVKAKTKQQTAESGAPASEVANKTGGGPKFPKCGDSTRDNVRNLLCTALCKDGNDPRAGNCAVEIETELNSRYGTDKKTVLTKVRSLLVVLRDVNNVELRSRLLSGDLQCQEFLNTDIKDLLSKERKEKEQEMKKKRNRDAAMAFQQGAHTDQYPCPKCKAKDAIYTQLQTRSADEPMTTFCACNVCGNRWKFC